VDPQAIEKLRVSRSDFLNALENDIKPAFGTSQELLQMMLTRGIINWGSPVSHILEDGMLLIQQVNQNIHKMKMIFSSQIKYMRKIYNVIC